MSGPSNWLRFRVDPESCGDPALRLWRARRFHDRGCTEFSISVNLEAKTLAFNARQYTVQVVGTNLSRELPFLDHPMGAYPGNPFRKSPEGSWTVLRVFQPEGPEPEPLFLLGLNSPQGQGMIVLGAAGRREPLESLLGLVADAND